MMTVKEIRELAEELRWEYDTVGIRTQDVPFEIGDIDHVSKVWDDGDETGEELDGLCVTDVFANEIKMHLGLDDFGSYMGEHTAIVCGDLVEYGVDPGEKIIKNAVVVKIIK